MSVLERLVLTAVVALGTVLVSGEGSAFAQGQAYERAQYEVDVPPPVELPTASTEADLFPSIGDGARSMQEPAYDANALDPSYLDSGYPEGDVIEPTPMADGEVYGEPYFTDMGADSYETMGPASDSPTPIYSTGSWWWRGNWYTQMDVMVLNLDDDFRNFVMQVGGVGLRFEELTAQHYTPGTRLKLGRFLGRDAASRDHLVEFSFMGLFNWESGRNVDSRNDPGAGDVGAAILVPGTTIDEFIQPFFNADRMGFFYESEFNDFQLNYKLQTRPGRDVMALQPNGMWVRHALSSQLRSVVAGLRVSSIDEQTSLTSQVLQPDGTEDERGRYIVRMNNDLFGVHVGGEITEKYDEWSWGIRGKAGGLVNLINRRSLIQSRIREDTEVVDRTQGENITDETLSLLVEAGLFGKYQLRPNLMVRAGYDIMLYSNVAFAAENIGFASPFPALNVNKTALYHGGYLGFETTW